MMQLPLVVGVGGLDRLRGSTQENEKPPAPRRRLSIPGPPPAALIAGRMVPSATLIKNIDISPQASRIST
jgi:hypothetical protein